MPELGEIRRGDELGYKSGGGYHKYIWHACERCGKERWVQLLRGKPWWQQCGSCNNSCRKNWKGGQKKTQEGYILVHLQPDDPYFSMVNNHGYVCEHRLVTAKHLGRPLTRREIVHHKGIKYPLGSVENRGHNPFENLKLFASDSEHQKYEKLKHNR